jgi:hypothetical protein
LAAAPISDQFVSLSDHQIAKTNTMTELRRAYGTLQRAGALLALTKQFTASKFHAHFKTSTVPKLQRQISAAIEKARRSRVLKAATRPEELHVRQHTGKGKSAFLTTIATRPDLFISAQLTRTLVRNRLAIALEGTPPRCGLCAKATTSPLHYIDCHGTRSQERLFLHTSVRKLVERVTRVGGGQFISEPPLDHRDNRHRRGDTQRFLSALGNEGEQQVFVDVQCLNTLAQSHIASFSDVSTIINRAERLKRSKYEESAEALDAQFVPFIVTLQGEFGPADTALLEKLEDRAGKALHVDCRLLLTLTIQRDALVRRRGRGSGASQIGGEEIAVERPPCSISSEPS